MNTIIIEACGHEGDFIVICLEMVHLNVQYKETGILKLEALGKKARLSLEKSFFFFYKENI